MQEIGKSQFLFSSLPHSIYQNQHCRSCRSRDNETHFSWSVSIYDVAQAFQPAGFGDFPVASFVRTEHGTRMSLNPQTRMSALHEIGVKNPSLPSRAARVILET